MPPAPTVQALNDLVSQYTTAQAPQQAQLDSEESQNETSGGTQQSGIDAAKTAAFGQITNTANARGATFSGFTPNAEAGYIGGTYLPALAKLQTAIATTRNTIAGNKAALTSTANANALNEQKTEQAALDTWNQNQAAMQAEEQRQQEAEAATAKENALNRASSQSIASTRAASSAASAAAKAGPVAQQRAGGGFNFQDSSGKAISARTYASLTGTNFNALLQQMANAGDAGAKGYLSSGGKQYSSALTWG